MEISQLDQRIENAKNGNEIARQQLINNNKPFILNIVSHICKRFISWNDDEASIGLLAFNRAIDTFEASKGRSFHSYVYCLINRDLINYFRKNKNHNQNLSLDYLADEEKTFSNEELTKSMQEYEEKIESSELVEEILELEDILKEYGIGFEELEDSSPKHRDTRELIFRMISDFVRDKELVYELLHKKRLPATTFSRKTGYSLKTIEKHKKFLITAIIINLHPEWLHLSSYIKTK